MTPKGHRVQRRGRIATPRSGPLGEERQHFAALQAMPGGNLTRPMGNSHFKNGLRDVDGDGGSLFHGLFLYGSRPVNPDDFGSLKPIKSGEESISSLERTRWARSVRFAGRQWWRAAQLQIR